MNADQLHAHLSSTNQITIMIPNETELTLQLNSEKNKDHNNFVFYPITALDGFLQIPQITTLNGYKIQGIMLECHEGKIRESDSHEHESVVKDTLKVNTVIDTIGLGYGPKSGIIALSLGTITLELDLLKHPGKPGGAIYCDRTLLFKAGEWI